MKIALNIIGFVLCLSLACCVNRDPGHTKLSASLEQTTLPSLKDKNVLIVYGGWPGHQPELFAEKAKHLLDQQGARVTVSESLDIYADSVKMQSMDLIIQSVTMDKIKRPQIDGLVKAVMNGAGFAGAHGGFCDSFRDNTMYQYMTGAQFVAHPGGKVDYTVNITGDSPITSGVGDFTTTTEQYYMHVDPSIEVLATTTFSSEHYPWIKGVVMPVVWTKTFGAGKVFCIALGHDPNEFDQQAAQTILMNGFRWAAR